ncbi:hypothetical protein SADUNF_Sadunf02G0005000 [Salix dunnii]|uniref:RNase H type-1 domain-containing protein n=1 Tax=Salix dunnii TaxID=1413687 RepID=A0A835N5C9_9ROSI|nr:hypothetical protein SADUNF_Sadunf02G0005000 [Salix dunnii]
MGEWIGIYFGHFVLNMVCSRNGFSLPLQLAMAFYSCQGFGGYVCNMHISGTPDEGDYCSGFVKLDADGNSWGNPGSVGLGCLIRTPAGHFVVGFAGFETNLLPRVLAFKCSLQLAFVILFCRGYPPN